MSLTQHVNIWRRDVETIWRWTKWNLKLNQYNSTSRSLSAISIVSIVNIFRRVYNSLNVFSKCRCLRHCLFSCPEQPNRWPRQWLTNSVSQSLTRFYFCHTKSNPRHLLPLRHLIRAMRRHDLTIFDDNFDDIFDDSFWWLVIFETLITILTIENLVSWQSLLPDN